MNIPPDSLCSAAHLTQTTRYADWAPDALKGFQALATHAFAAGALSVREKEIVAFGCAHALRCPYCIDYHHGLATKAGATRDELVDAVWVAIAVAAHAPYAHASLALRLMNGERPETYYSSGWATPLAGFADFVPAALGGYAALQGAAFEAGALTTPFKHLVAVACAHDIRCAFSIEHHVTQALVQQCTREQIAEAAFVAIEMAAGACLGHAGLAAALMARPSIGAERSPPAQGNGQSSDHPAPWTSA